MAIGIQEITLILIVVLILFGGKRIPELAKAFGRASYEFKKAKYSIKKELDELNFKDTPIEYKPQDNPHEPTV